MQPFDEQVISAVLVFGFWAIFAVIGILGTIAIYKQINEGERIKRLPKYYKEGRLLVRRSNPDGTLQDLSFDLIAFENEDPEAKQIPETTKRGLPQIRSGVPMRRDLVHYRPKN